MTEIYGTFVGRWYVTVLGLVFVWRASRHLGWRNTGLYTLVALAVGGLAENGSVHLGVPYTGYTFNAALRGKELFLGDVPLMVPLSYTFMGYFGFAAGRMVASGPRHTRAPRPWQEYLLGLVLTVWAVWIMDPVSRLGHRWFLGEVFHYNGPGFWFGLPLGSQAGFTLTAAILVGLLTYLTRNEPDRPVRRFRDHPHQVALVTYHAQVAWLVVVAAVLDATEIAGAGALMWVPAAAVTAVLWSRAGAAPPSASPRAVPSAQPSEQPTPQRDTEVPV